MTRSLGEIELLHLIDVLADAGWHSGETLAAHAGITRAGLGKRVRHLREWGLDIESLAGRGYRLDRALERLSAEKIAPLLSAQSRGRLTQLTVLPRTDSTNERLLEADASADPQALFAENQTAGRGRRGRIWRSPFGANLYLSLSWTFPAWPARLSMLPLAVGVAAARALRAAGLTGILLKWPNDLRVGSAKLGGILIEQRGEAGGACRVIVGIGLNVAMSSSQAIDVDQAWTSVNAELEVIGRPAGSRTTLAGAVLNSLIEALLAFERSGFDSFAAQWAEMDITFNRRVKIESAGSAAVVGTARGIDDSGALIIESLDGSRQAFHAGEVSLRLGAADEAGTS